MLSAEDKKVRMMNTMCFFASPVSVHSTSQMLRK